MVELSGQLDEVVVGDFTVSVDDERLDQLALDYRLSLNYLQGTLCKRFSIGLRSCDWTGKAIMLMLFWHFQLVTSLAR